MIKNGYNKPIFQKIQREKEIKNAIMFVIEEVKETMLDLLTEDVF